MTPRGVTLRFVLLCSLLLQYKQVAPCYSRMLHDKLLSWLLHVKSPNLTLLCCREKKKSQVHLSAMRQGRVPKAGMHGGWQCQWRWLGGTFN